MNFPVWNYPYAACFASASIVLSPVFYLADKKLPPEGASTLNLVAIVARCQTPAIADTKRHNPQLTTIHYPPLTINYSLSTNKTAAIAEATGNRRLC